MLRIEEHTNLVFIRTWCLRWFRLRFSVDVTFGEGLVGILFGAIGSSSFVLDGSVGVGYEPKAF